MKKPIRLFVIFLFLISNLKAQSIEVNNLIEAGIQLHDKGDYAGAISMYQKALALDESSDRANYEIASGYFALKDYERSIEYCDKVIKFKSRYLPETYILKGTALDVSGHAKEAIKSYKTGIKKFPGNYLLLYNLGYTYSSLKEHKSAEEVLRKALIINSRHASSHLLLGYVMGDQRERIKSILALYNFLLLEPTGDRAVAAYDLLDKQLSQGVKKETDQSISIILSADKKSDEFRTAELSLSLLQSTNYLEENKKKSAQELFADNTKTFFSILGEMNKGNGFWWNYYVDFFYSLTKQNHCEAFSYYISQSEPGESVNSWIKENKIKVDDLLQWFSSYTRKTE